MEVATIYVVTNKVNGKPQLVLRLRRDPNESIH